jgi:hypothetical protein
MHELESRAQNSCDLDILYWSNLIYNCSVKDYLLREDSYMDMQGDVK